MGLADYLASHYADRPEKKGKKKEKKKKEATWKSLDTSKTAQPQNTKPELLQTVQQTVQQPVQETVYRDNDGKVIDKRQWQQLHGQYRADPEDSKGIVQQMKQQEDQKKLAEIADQPLERYKDDPLHNEQLKQQARADDPMAEPVSEEIVAPVSKYTGIPLFVGRYPDNRFGIAPSYKWDGIDRSNGFEKRWLERHSRG